MQQSRNYSKRRIIILKANKLIQFSLFFYRTESIEVAIGILKDLEAEYMKSWFMELRPSYGSFKIDVNNIAVAKRM